MRREDRRVVEDTIDVRAGETNGSLGQGAEINVWIDMLVAGVDLENRFASFLVGQGNRDGAVKASRAAKSRVKDVVAVRCGDDKDTGVGFEAIHFDEQLVESLLAFVVAAAQTSAALAANGIDFVNENQAGGRSFRLFE